MHTLMLSSILIEGIQVKIRVPKHIARYKDIYHYIILLALWLQWKQLWQVRYSTPPVWFLDLWFSCCCFFFGFFPLTWFKVAHSLLRDARFETVCWGIKLINVTARTSDNHIPWFLKRAGELDQNIKVWFNVTFLFFFFNISLFWTQWFHNAVLCLFYDLVSISVLLFPYLTRHLLFV